jgi:hypothetical protein
MTNKKKLGIVAILISLITAGAVGVASAHGSDGDANADRTARKEKWEARKAEMLAKYDLNKDGKLDASEKAAMRDDLLTQQFAKLDTNGDGKLSLDEFKAGMKARGFRFGRMGHRHGHRSERKLDETK